MALMHMLEDIFFHDTVTFVSKGGQRYEILNTQSPEHLMPAKISQVTTSLNKNKRVVSIKKESPYELTVSFIMTKQMYKFLEKLEKEGIFSVELTDSNGVNDPLFLVDCFFPNGIPAAPNSMDAEAMSSVKINGTKR